MMGATSFALHDASTWQPWHYCAFAGVIMGGLEILSRGVIAAFRGKSKSIPVRGKHLDEFETIDTVYIWINKFLTALFVYHAWRFCWTSPSVSWSLDDLSIKNGPVAYVLFHIVYDFFYTIFHRFLHNRSLYRFIHKHHHRQRAPTRGNLDAINVHPFEFLVGEYLHLFSIYLIPCHMLTVAVFIIGGGIFASLNHTRYDLSFFNIYDVKVHDVHHRLPETNYGQYIMLWDRLMGSYKPYVPAKTE